MKKIILAVMLQCLIVGWCHAKKPINTTPPIEGRVIDATTGEPLENVVVSAQWVESSPTFGGDVSKTFHSFVTVTDKEGRYKIPKKRSFHMYSLIPLIIDGSKFERIDISFLHPLYETTRVGYLPKDRISYPTTGPPTRLTVDGVYDGKGGSSIVKNGVILYDVKLMSLEEKYTKPEDNYDFGSFFQTYWKGGYFYILKKRGLSFNLEKIFSEWDKLAKRFPEEKQYKLLQRSLAEAKIGIKKAVEGRVK